MQYFALKCIKRHEMKRIQETQFFLFFHSIEKKKNHNKEELKKMQRQFRKGNQEQVVNLHEIVYKTFGGNIYSYYKQYIKISNKHNNVCNVCCMSMWAYEAKTDQREYYG